jgi:hypothetical protein
MILIFCPECDDIVSLTDREMRYCKCKKSGGMYVNEVRAEIEGKAVPLEVDIDHIKIECKRIKKSAPFSFWAFIPPDDSPFVYKQPICSRCRNDQTSQLDVVDHPENSKDDPEDSQGYQIYKCRMCGEYHGCRYQYNRGSGSDNRWAMLGKDPAKVKRHY